MTIRCDACPVNWLIADGMTVITNAVVRPGHLAIQRRPAHDLQSDSDLGERPATVDVGALTAAEVAQARGLGVAGGVLRLGGQVRMVGSAG